MIDEELAELIGRHLGDGSLVKNPKTNGYRVVLTEEENLLLYFDLPLNIRKRVVRGLMDTDGSLYYSKNQNGWTIELNMVHKDAIDFVSNVLKETNITHNVSIKQKKRGNRRVSYSLKIIGYKNIQKYFKHIGSCKWWFPSESRGAPG